MEFDQCTLRTSWSILHISVKYSHFQEEIPDGTWAVTDRDRPRWAVRNIFPEMDFLSWDNLYLNHPWNAWYSLSEYPSSLANLSTKIIETLTQIYLSTITKNYYEYLMPSANMVYLLYMHIPVNINSWKL